MDTNNRRPNQGTEPNMDNSGWRSQLPTESRQIVVNKIMDILRHLPGSGQEGLHELWRIAQRLEEKFFTAATSQDDYQQKVSLKMLSLEAKFSGNMANNLPSNQVIPSNKPPDPGFVLQSQVHNPGQQHPMALSNQPQSCQQLLSQNTQNNITSQPNLLPVSSMAQTPIHNVGQISNMQNVFAGSQRQMPGRQQVVPQQQQQSQNQQQQQQQNLLHPNQLNSSQHSAMQTLSVMQPSMMQTSLSEILQNQQSNNVQQSTQCMLQQQPQVVRQQPQQQTSILRQQQTPMAQQSLSAQQQQQRQQQQLLGSQANPINMRHTQMLGPQSNVSDMQQPQLLGSQANPINMRHTQMLGPQSNVSDMQQPQRLVAQQNNLSNMHQQLGNSVHGLQPQQVIGPQSGNSGMQTSQHSAHMMQQQSKVPMQQQSQQNALNLSPSQMKQSQPQALQPQLVPQVQSRPAQLQQQLGLQQQPNPLRGDMQHRPQASCSLRQQQSVLDQQKQLYQSQRPRQETSPTPMDSTAQTGLPNEGDWQEEVYQKIKTMKENYMPELIRVNAMYQNFETKIQQNDSLSQQQKSDQLEKLKIYKSMLDRILSFLQVPKGNISLNMKEKFGAYEQQIVNFINKNRPRTATSSLQPGQIPPTNMPSMSQSQSQDTQVQSQLQTTNVQGSVATMLQNNMTSMQQSTMSGESMAQQNTMNSMQPVTNLGSGTGNAMNSLQQVPVSSLQPNPISAPQRSNTNSLSSQGGVNVIQSSLNPLQEGSSMLQHQQVKQQQEQQMLQNQQLKQNNHQRQLMQRQQILQQQQQLHQPAKQQLSVQSQMRHMQRLHPHQRSAYRHQQLKQGSPFPVSSPQRAASPQIPQHSSPQVDQGNHHLSLTKVATPLQSSNSAVVGPTPSPPLAPSPMPGDSEKPISGLGFSSSMSNAANIGHQQTSSAAAPAHSLAIETPGISASPLLAEFSGPDGPHGNALTPTSGTSTVTDQPIERLIEVIKSMSSKALSAAVSDIRSVVSMNDRMAGSALGNGSSAAVGQDLAAVTNCRLQARDFTTQRVDGADGTWRMNCYVDATPLSDNINQLTALEASDLESPFSGIRKPRLEANHALLEEIREINQRHIRTVLNTSDEEVDSISAVAAAKGAEGTIVKCSFVPVALSSEYASQMLPIRPLRLLVPTDYPNSSPILLDKFLVESSEESENLSEKAEARFIRSLRCLSEPMSLGDLARNWDMCVRTVITEHAQRLGGGTFSSKYGTWEDCRGGA